MRQLAKPPLQSRCCHLHNCGWLRLHCTPIAILLLYNSWGDVCK